MVTGRRLLAPGAALYECRITHTRLAPLKNVFSYGTYLWLVDLDHLPRPGRVLRLLAGFNSRDHLDDPKLTIRGNLDRFLLSEGIDLDGGRVMMLTNARVLGYVFNPLTVFWCHRPDGALACVVAEVHNTYRQRHAYLLRPDERGRAQTQKEFYVSPFYPVDGGYRMTLPEPGPPEPGTARAQRPRTPHGPGAEYHAHPSGRQFVRRQRARHRPAGHHAGAARRRRQAPLVHGGRHGPHPVAGHPALPARAARRSPATSPTQEGVK